MSTYSRLEVLNAVVKESLIPIFYNGEPEVAKNVLLACHQGGSKFLEFTNRGDFAIDVFRELSEKIRKEKLDIILGAGTIYDESTAAQFVSYGANFIVSPFLNEGLARFCNKRKIAYIPGCATTTEISRAEENGAEVIKLYPGSSVGGPDYVKTILGPMPWTRIMPTGGIETEYENLSAWFKAGVTAVGIGVKLIQPANVKNHEYEKITDKVSQVVKWISEIKSKLGENTG
jgi:2-dehydro-3-deoxyphosphogluconate aldolase/(4S)-4-hydroxy-2-oxoglutarate aldolase